MIPQESSLTTRDHAFSVPELLWHFSELSPQAMLTVEGTTHLVRHVNPAFLRLSGMNRSAVIGLPFAEVVPESRTNGCISLLDRVFRTGNAETLPEQKHGADGAAYWSYAVWAIPGNDHGPAGVVVQVTDSTEMAIFRAEAAAMNQAMMVSLVRQHELIEAAEQARAKYAGLFVAMDEGFCIIEKVEGKAGEPLDFRFVEANPAFEAESGGSGVVGKTIRQAFTGASEDWFLTYDGVLRTKTPIRFERALDRPRRVLTVYAFPVDDQSHSRVAVIFKDITARKQAEEALAKSHAELESHTQQVTELNQRLQAAIKEKEYFIAVLSHELRTPLAPVLIAVSLLEQDKTLETDTREIMQMIHQNLSQEARLIDDLIDMTRMERGNLKLERRAVDLREVVQRAVEVCCADLEAGELALTVETGNRPQIVDVDAGRLQQVFSNLLRNAIKFTPPGGRVRVISHVEGNSFVVEVTDSGAGIDPEFLPRAFGAFEQGEKSHSGKAGLGLGLAICKAIVELHGGIITAQSEGKNRGATFAVKLPVMVGVHRAHAHIRPDPKNSSRPVKALRILLVEDHADTARIMRRLLALDGHTVQWGSNVSAGLKLAAEHEFDLLLSDVGLPDGTGIDLMRTLRQNGSMLPGIVLSGYGQEEDVARSHQAGFATHLVKPVTLRGLRDAIASQTE
jgi:PAS domain S-box-containing protein